MTSYKYDAARTGVTNATLPGSDATRQWATDPDVQNALLVTWAAVDRHRVYAAILTFGQFPAAVVAFDRETGTVEWRHDTSGSAPALAGEDLYIADDRVRALARADGSERWVATPAPDAGFGAPAVVDDTVYATSGETVYAFDVADGSTRWTADRGLRAGGPVAVAGETVYAANAARATEDGDEVVALDAADGTELWRRPIPNTVRTTPAVTDDGVYVGDVEGTVYGIDRSDGTERWRRTVGRVPSSPAVADGRAYVGTREGVVALGVGDGSVEWRQSASRSGQSFRFPITLADDGLVVPGGKALTIHDPTDGAKQYELVGEVRAISGATVADGAVYTGTLRSGTFEVLALGE